MQLSALNEWLSSSFAELRLHRVGCLKPGEADKTRAEIRIGRHAPNKIGVQLWWVNVPSVVANEFLWDDCEVSDADEQAVATELDHNGPGLVIAPRPAKALSRQAQCDVPMFEFQPQRFRALHPLGKEMASVTFNDVGFSQQTMQRAANALMNAQQQEKRFASLRRQVGNDTRKSFNDVVQMGMFFADFHAAGKHIFNFPPALTAMFRRTDVDDIHLDALQMPYRTIYLAFGQQVDLQTPEGWMVDGAYVSVLGDRQAMQFALTFAPPDTAQYARWMECPEPVYVQAMDAQSMRIGVGEAADQVLSNKIAELRRQITSPSPLGMFEGAQIKDISGANASAELERVTTLHTVWAEALKLVINALAYLGAYPDDMGLQWPEKTPQRLYLQTQDGSDKQRRNAVSKLAALGYTSIHLCGQRFNHAAGQEGENPSSRPSGNATWVRGHWIRQVHGEGRALRKLQWRMPFLRNASEAGSNEPDAHLYQVQ